MKMVALVDLDDTLFQTIRKCPEDIPHDLLTPLGFAADGSPLSYATPRQIRFLEWLLEVAIVIPVTARSLDATRRVRFEYSSAICANGGIMIGEDGRIDQQWHAKMTEAAEPHAGNLRRLAALAETAAIDAGHPMRSWIVGEDDLPLYVVVKSAELKAEHVSDVVERMRDAVPAGWTIHVNGNNASFSPPYLGKAAAVARIMPDLRTRHPDATIIGVGDSLTDAPFMALCDMAMCPPRSQLGQAVLGAHL